MVLPKTERPFSKLGYFLNTEMFALLAVVIAVYVAVNFLFLHWGGIHTPTDAIEAFVGGTLGCYLGICLVNLAWDSLFY